MKLRSLASRTVLLTLLASAALVAQTGPDVSTYPDPATLPGKGSNKVWEGLAKEWNSRHRQWASRQAADHGSIVFLGDSITQFWSSLPRDFRGYKVANRGISGDTTRGVLYRLQSDVLALDPEAVVLLIGTNDVGDGSDPDDIRDNIKEILARIKAHNSKTPIIVCEVMPRADAQVPNPDKIKKLNASLVEMVKGDPQLTLCDTWSIFADADGHCSVSEFPDHLHPNAIGYAKWTSALRPLFTQLKLATAAGS